MFGRELCADLWRQDSEDEIAAPSKCRGQRQGSGLGDQADAPPRRDWVRWAVAECRFGRLCSWQPRDHLQRGGGILGERGENQQ